MFRNFLVTMDPLNNAMNLRQNSTCMEVLFSMATINRLYSGAQPETFQGRRGFVKLEHLDKHFINNSRKKVPAGKVSEYFVLDTLKTTF